MNIAFIPVRAGSKSIPLKNIKEINGKPLVYWTTKAANDANELIKDFKNDASIKNNKPFQDVLSLVNKEYIAESKW